MTNANYRMINAHSA